MNIRQQYTCSCGRTHACPIRCVEIRDDAIEALSAFCEGKAVLLVSDVHTDAVCGRAIAERMHPAGRIVLGCRGEVLIPNEAALAAVGAAVTDGIDLIVGVGSGVINDICKYVSFGKGLPYAIVATAPSMDGYASSGAALILGGMKVTYAARPPIGIFAEPRVLASAPAEMIRSGYGDIIGKFSCLNDWLLGREVRGEFFCPEIYETTYRVARSVLDAAERIASGETEAVVLLMEALVTVGVMMSYAGNSRPASGSEHHLSHYFEIRGILDQKPYFPHGIDVAFSSVITARLRESIIRREPRRRHEDRAAWEREIRRIYTTAADGVIALQDKVGFYRDEDIPPKKWEAVKAILAEAPGEQETLGMLARGGLDFSDFVKRYGEDRIADGIRFAKDLKDRYTVLWLYDFYFGEETANPPVSR